MDANHQDGYVMTNQVNRPQSPQRFFLDAPKQKDGECYVLNWDYMELDAYCVHLLKRVDGYRDALGRIHSQRDRMEAERDAAERRHLTVANERDEAASLGRALLAKAAEFRGLLRDVRASVGKAADADCVCVDGPQQCKYCAPHRALLERIDAALKDLPHEPSG
jgi:hypothetical protein